MDLFLKKELSTNVMLEMETTAGLDLLDLALQQLKGAHLKKILLQVRDL